MGFTSLDHFQPSLKTARPMVAPDRLTRLMPPCSKLRFSSGVSRFLVSIVNVSPPWVRWREAASDPLSIHHFRKSCSHGHCQHPSSKYWGVLPTFVQKGADSVPILHESRGGAGGQAQVPTPGALLRHAGQVCPIRIGPCAVDRFL